MPLPEIERLTERLEAAEAERDRLLAKVDYFRQGEIDIVEQERQWDELVAERDRLLAALERIAEEHDDEDCLEPLECYAQRRAIARAALHSLRSER